MSATSLDFDHVHVIAKDPHATAAWYVNTLGGQMKRSVVTHGAPQITITFGAATVIVRGERPGEKAAGKAGFEWGIDHFGLRVSGEFDSFCAQLKQQGVTFCMEPTDANPTTRIAFINAPDGVTIELLTRKD